VTRALLEALRPWQWLKNLIVFAALIFGMRAGDLDAVALASAAFVVFCLLASAGYLLNDLRDLALDRAHPDKARRPIASGALPVRVAAVTAVVFAVLGLALAVAITAHDAPLPGRFYVLAAAYLGLSVAYSTFLKHAFLVDVLTITVGFLLRVAGGGAVLGVEISSWLLVCTFFLACFLGLGKRRGELARLETDTANRTRPVLAEYRVEVLDVLVAVAAAALLVCYVLYTVSARTVEEFGTRDLFWTIPFAFYGIGRFLALSMRPAGAEDPALLFWRDRPLQVAFVLWALTTAGIIYA